MLRAFFACALALLSLPVLAAESYDSCVGTITSLPASISTQGTWCLRGDLATSLSSGNAITIATNNVTLDCNGFKLGGLGGGPATLAVGVIAFSRSNVTVRNCTVRGFMTGIYLFDGSGHVIEHNRLDGNTDMGIRLVDAEAVDVRGNVVVNTGGSFDSTWHNPIGIIVDSSPAAVVRDNLVHAVAPDTNLWPGASSIGILVESDQGVTEGNRVSGIVSGASGFSVGIWLQGQQAKAIDNTVGGLASGGNRHGFICPGGGGAIVAGNLVSSASADLSFNSCPDDGGNVAR